MGRYYYGDIEGKFWVGVQSSGDICELIDIEPINTYLWKICLCSADICSQDNVLSLYCKDCYKSRDEHMQAAIDEGEDGGDDTLYFEDNFIGFNIEKSTHYQELLDSMENIKHHIPHDIIQSFENIEQTDDILNAFTGVFDTTLKLINNITDTDPYTDPDKLRETEVLIARYTLAYQIEYCLRNNDSCEVSCEC